jgi:long-chain acyl-CoA synthetase
MSPGASIASQTVLMEVGGRECSRSELQASCNRFVRACRQAGLRAGDPIAIIAPNCIEYVVAYLAVLQMGCYLVPINHNFTAAEVAHILADSEARALIAHDEIPAKLREALGSLTANCAVRVSIGAIPGFTELRNFLQVSAAPVPESSFCGAIMAYTSATTGKPKGVRRPLASGLHDRMAKIFADVPGDDVHLCSSKLHHTPVLMQVLSELEAGHRVVLFGGRWDPMTILATIERYRVTTALMVPTMFVKLLKLPDGQRQRFDVSSLRYVVHTGAPCPVHVKHEMIAWWGPILWERYGSTEGGVTLVDSEAWLKFPGTVGLPEPGIDVRILDDGGRELPAGEVGEIYISIQPGRDFEYKGDAAKTAASRRDGYYSVGDVGYKNASGYLYICDRKIDMIISGGVNVYAAEVEQILIQHPAVEDCAVVGVPDEIYGEVPKAIVQPARDVLVDGTLSDDIIGFIALRLARFKVPKHLEFRAALPRDPTGKLRKSLLRDPPAASSGSQ